MIKNVNDCFPWDRHKMLCLLLFCLMSGLFCSNGLNEKTGVCLEMRI